MLSLRCFKVNDPKVTWRIDKKYYPVAAKAGDCSITQIRGLALYSFTFRVKEWLIQNPPGPLWKGGICRLGKENGSVQKLPRRVKSP